jgi:hypothetical protein
LKPGYEYKTPEDKRAYHREYYNKTKRLKVKWRDDGAHRRCTKCNETKLRELEFNKLPHGRLGYQSECKTCKNKRHKGAAPSWTGLTREQYQKHVREGKCFICNENKPRMAVDHCHVTQTKRGVLCPSCNTGLGHFQDRPELLEKAAAYLRR